MMTLLILVTCILAVTDIVLLYYKVNKMFKEDEKEDDKMFKELDKKLLEMKELLKES